MIKQRRKEKKKLFFGRPAEASVAKGRDGSTRTLQRSCHGANGQSGAEGQESSAPVWKINDCGAAGGERRTETVEKKLGERGLGGEARLTSEREPFAAFVTKT